MAYISQHTGNEIDTGITNIQQIFNLIYPVGSYYMSSSATNPGTLFGGTWEQIKDRMIMAAGSNYSVGTTGGSSSHTHTSAAHTHTTAGHTLTVNEMPIHKHTELATFHQGNDTQSYGSGSIFNSSARYSYTGGAAMQNVLATANENCTGDAGGGASHSHGDTGSTTPGATGSSSSLPPYIVAYIWRRTA